MSRSMGVTAAVVTVGEELLSGETTDTNGAWLGRKLASLGAPVVRRWVVGDDAEAIQAALSAAFVEEPHVEVSLRAAGRKLGMDALPDRSPSSEDVVRHFECRSILRAPNASDVPNDHPTLESIDVEYMNLPAADSRDLRRAIVSDPLALP